MRIDSHQHFWAYDAPQYEWMTDDMQVLRRDYLPEELWTQQDPLGFQGSVAVQARQSVEESRWLLELADNDPRILGVVGWVDLRSDELEEQLAQFAPHPRFVGVRHVVQDEPDNDFMLREDFQRGIASLPAFNMVYDILIYERQLPAAFELVKCFPDQPFVLDHIAKPLITDGIIEPWEERLRMLAELPNLTCKISGMITEAKWDTWTDADLRPYMDVALESFGPERLMIGSDWPVCRLAGEYDRVMGLVLEFISGLSESEQAAILGGNCARAYGLPVQGDNPAH